MKKLHRILLTVLGALCGLGVYFIIEFIIRELTKKDELAMPLTIAVSAACVIAGAIISYLIAPAFHNGVRRMSQKIDISLQKVSPQELIFGTIGLILGLLIAFLISQLWAGLPIPMVKLLLTAIAYILFGYLGLHISTGKANDLAAGFRLVFSGRSVSGTKASKSVKGKGKGASPKILDTSVIIDGRIADIMKTGFIEGTVVIPEFVLVELRHIADSADGLKRNRGRRGLDILNRMQEQFGIEIYNTTNEKSLDSIPEVDVKLLELASIMNGKVVTNDYNLNKVASIKGVPVLNINELANTLKPVVLPGEEMRIVPLKEGKEYGQAIAYLDDGTMIVVEDGRQFIGEEITVIVSSVLQTAAGRMIFAKSRSKGAIREE